MDSPTLVLLIKGKVIAYIKGGQRFFLFVCLIPKFPNKYDARSIVVLPSSLLLFVFRIALRATSKSRNPKGVLFA